MTSAPVAGAGRSWPWRWFAAQYGSREHYAVPRALHLTSRLEALYTASWCRRGHRLLRRGPASLWAYAGHHHPDLPSTKVISFDVGAVGWFVQRGLIARPKTVEEVYRWEMDNSRWFGRRIVRELRRSSLNPESDAFFGFSCESLEPLEHLRERGVPTILDLAGPGRMDDQMIRQEIERWPGWATMGPEAPANYYERLGAECRAATLTMVNSEWSRRSWIQQGVPDEKIIVVPLAYEPLAQQAAVQPRQAHDRPLTVLWLGRVILRKGIPYLVEAAKLLRDTSVQFVVAGPLGISSQAVESAPPNMTFLGRVTNEQTNEWYRRADVFVLPTMSDGFAITQLEAMAHGLPVIATPNCGDVVSDGVDGFIVPAGDAESLADAIAKLDESRGLLASMSQQALVKSRQFSVRRVGEMLNLARSAIGRAMASGGRARPESAEHACGTGARP